MNFLKKMFRTTENPMLTKLESASKLTFKEVFYSFGFIYSTGNFAKFSESLKQNTLAEIKNDLLFDVGKDNLEIYFVIDTFNKKSVILLIDFYEPLQKEIILAQIPLEEFPTIEMRKLK